MLATEVHCRVCPALRAGPLSTLTPAQLGEIEVGARHVDLDPGDILFRESAPSTAAFIVVSGSFKLRRVAFPGPAIVRQAIAGDLLGLPSMLSGQPMQLTAECLEKAHVCSLRRDAVERMISSSRQFCESLLRQLATELEETREALVIRADLPVDLKLGLCLSRLLKDHARGHAGKADGEVSLKVSRYDLAEMIGSAQETVSRSLGRLEAIGALRRDGRRVVVVDGNKLPSLEQAEAD
jgi:CRP-like cAMP-binding protein